MKIIDAFWELRNLGKKTLEISIEKKDIDLPIPKILQIVENAREEYDAQYLVVKVDVKYPAVSIEFQRAGFLLIENQIGLRTSRRDALKALEEYKKIFGDKVSYRLANTDEIKLVCSEIAKGMFTTDRIALDPNFGIEIANRRYINWLQDEIKRGGLLYIYKFNGEDTGFFLNKPDKEKLYGILGGVFNHFQSKNPLIGTAMMYSNWSSLCDNGYKFHKTDVSSSNIGSLILHTLFGSKITEIKNVLVKHYENNLNGGGLSSQYAYLHYFILKYIRGIFIYRRHFCICRRYFLLEE